MFKKTSSLYNLATFTEVPLVSSHDEFKAAAIGLYWTGWSGYLLSTFHYPLIFMPMKQYAIIHHMSILDSLINTGLKANHFDMNCVC